MASLINNITLNTNVNEKKPVQTENKSYLLNEPIKDTVEIKNKSDDKDKKLSTATKAGIAASIGVLSAIGFALYKARFTEIKKLAENIDFQPAKTLQEAIDFTKAKLGIDNVIGFEEKDLAVLNWANQGFVNVVNTYKGKLRMPKFLVYDSKNLDENMIAGVINKPNSNFYGYFGINKNYFDNIDKQIEKAKEFLESEKYFYLKSDTEFNYNSDIIPEKTAQYIATQFINYNNKTISFEDKVFLSEIEGKLTNIIAQKTRRYVQDILKNKEYTQMLETAGVDTKKLLTPLSSEKISEYFEIINNLIKEKKIKVQTSPKNKSTIKVSPYRTLYHEMGHIQDMLPRPLTTCYYNFDESKYSKELLEWVNNKENIDAASEISYYSGFAPGEFIAEAFAEMITGNKLSDKVMDLYKKLGGPSIPNIV